MMLPLKQVLCCTRLSIDARIHLKSFRSGEAPFLKKRCCLHETQQYRLIQKKTEQPRKRERKIKYNNPQYSNAKSNFSKEHENHLDPQRRSFVNYLSFAGPSLRAMSIIAMFAVVCLYLYEMISARSPQQEEKKIVTLTPQKPAEEVKPADEKTN